MLDRGLGHAVLAPDFLGFGLSDKPRDHLYSLFWQADLIESLAAAADRPTFIVAHDMGTSVATELLARDLEGRLGFDLRGALLFNGSIVLDRATPDPRPAAAARPPRRPLLAALQRARSSAASSARCSRPPTR